MLNNSRFQSDTCDHAVLGVAAFPNVNNEPTTVSAIVKKPILECHINHAIMMVVAVMGASVSMLVILVSVYIERNLPSRHLADCSQISVRWLARAIASSPDAVQMHSAVFDKSSCEERVLYYGCVMDGDGVGRLQLVDRVPVEGIVVGEKYD